MGFSSRKRTKSIYTGSKLSVPGQGIYTVKLTKPEKVQVNTQVNRELRPTPTPTPSTSVNVTPTPTPTPVPSTSVTPTPTVTVTPTITPTITVTPTITPTPSCARPGGLTDFTFLSSITSPIFFPFSESLGNACGAKYIYDTFGVARGGSVGKLLSFTEGEYVYSFFGTGCEQFDDGYYNMPIDNSVSQVQNGYLSFPTCPLPFISIWRTTSPNETITLPYEVGGTYDGVIDWGDGTWSANTYDNRNHIYVTPGDYTIKVVGTVNGFNFFNTGYESKIREITQWGGGFRLGNNGNYFRDCINLKLTGVTDTLNLNGTNNLYGMFSYCTSLTSVANINDWDVSNVIEIGSMFYNTLFNQSLSGWTVSNVVGMSSTFQKSLFNQNINNWDVSNVGNMSGTFAESPFNQPLDLWDVSSVYNMNGMFSITPFNQPIGNWNVSAVTTFDAMFYSCTSFNQPIGNWNMLNSNYISGMFWGATSFNQNINNWNISNVIGAYGIFNGCTSFNQPLDSWDVSNLTNPFSMQYMFNGCTSFNQDLSSWCVPSQPSLPPNFDTGASSWVLPRPVWGTCPIIPFISIWRTTSPNETITLPYENTGTYNGIIDWGDGNTSVNSYANRTHTYVTPGDYTVSVSGNCIGFRFNNGGDITKIIEITKWGKEFRLGNNGYYFAGCSNLVLSGVTDVLNLQGTTNLDSMFSQCTQITTINRINEWNVSNVTSMNGMFVISPFNQPLSGWNVSNVTEMIGMFNQSLFNQPIGNWDVSNVTNMGFMFYTTPFNQPIGNWNVSNVTYMGYMFHDSQFNQDISGWDVSNVTEMSSMFYSTPFNQPLDTWDVSSVTNMNGIFAYSSFNQPIGNWNFPNLTDMSGMFSSTPFNQPLSGWNMSNITNTQYMFYSNSSFNQPIGNWNMSGVTNMQYMFRGSQFNQDISGWDVSKVTNMNSMFEYAFSFNRDLSGWCVPLIPSLPTNFNTGASSWVLPKPVWGTCPP